MSRATNDLEKMSEALQTGLLRLFMAAGTILAPFFSIMAYFDGFLTAVFCSFHRNFLLAAKAASKRPCAMRPDARTARENSTALSKKHTAACMLIKAFNREEESLVQIRQAAVELADASEKTEIGSSMPLTPESALSTGSDRLLWLFWEVLCS